MTLKKSYFGEFEIIKALAILGLPLVHFIEEAGYEMLYIADYSERFFDSVIFLTVFGPAVFMICMGTRIQKEYSCKRMITNGIQFLMIGYLLNFVCFTIPQLIYAMINGVMYDGDNLVDVAFQDMLGGDIYIFVGWFYLFFGLLKKYFKNITNFALLAISCFLLVVNNFRGHQTELPYNVLTQFLGNFVTVNDQSYFPLFGWAVFPVIGMLMREFLTENNGIHYHKRMTRILIVGVGGLCLLHGSLYVYDIDTLDILINFTQNYTMDVFTAFLLVLLSVTGIALISKIYYAVRENVLEKFLMRISSFIMSYYIIQWLLVSIFTYYGLFLFYDVEGCLSIPVATVCVILIWGLSLLLTYRYGYTVLQFVLKITNYTKWFKKKKKSVA